MDQPGIVTNPVCGELDRKNDIIIPVPVCACEFDLGRRVRLSGSAGLNVVLFGGFLSLSVLGSVMALIYLYRRQPPSGQFRAYEVTDFECLWHSLPRGCQRKASIFQGDSSRGCCIFMFHYGPVNVSLLLIY